MAQEALSQQSLNALKAYDTPTICNALEVIDPVWRVQGFTVKPLVCAFPQMSPIVGYAKTGQIRAMQPSPLGDAAAKKQRLAYYAYVNQGDMPKISVIQDLDSQPGFGAFWGEVNTNIHKALGCLGVVTNGSIRDLDMVASDFQLLAGSVGPAHAWVHTQGHASEVNIHGMTVCDGDILHADRHGAVVVPACAVERLPGICERLGRKEKVILDACQKQGFSFADLQKAMGDAEHMH